jgi:uncharacterized membrane protein YphA (DoxX/SURF4 family)
MEALAFVARVVLSAVFVTAALAKLSRRAEFTDAVRNYGLVPDRWVPRVAGALPWAELSCGVLLAAGVRVRLAGVVTAALLAAFAVGIVANLVRGRRVGCGCFGETATRPATWFTAVRNAVLIAAALLVAARPPLALSVHRLSAHGLAALDALALLIASTALLLSWALAGELRRLPR